jgi:hypothetical protein
MLDWQRGDDGVYHAADRFASYVINFRDGAYRVGYTPTPGPELRWNGPFDDLESAKQSAESCVEFVSKIER